MSNSGPFRPRQETTPIGIPGVKRSSAKNNEGGRKNSAPVPFDKQKAKARPLAASLPGDCFIPEEEELLFACSFIPAKRKEGNPLVDSAPALLPTAASQLPEKKQGDVGLEAEEKSSDLSSSQEGDGLFELEAEVPAATEESVSLVHSFDQLRLSKRGSTKAVNPLLLDEEEDPLAVLSTSPTRGKRMYLKGGE